MAQDTPLGFPAHTLPYRRGEFTTLSTVSHGLKVQTLSARVFIYPNSLLCFYAL